MKKRFTRSIPILLILALSAVLNLWRIWAAGFGNLYYAAGVHSMGASLHAFFYGSLDSVGFVTVDKPPLGLWIQVLFTKLFGFTGPVLMLPQAIACVAAVWLIRRIVARRFGEMPGLAAALVLTLTPIFVAVARNNTVDGILIFLMVAASDLAILAAERSSPRLLIAAGALVGLAFNVKMLQAYMIVPAVYLTWLIFARGQRVWRRVASAAAAAAVMVIVSASWIIAVDLTPASSRPYVGSSGTNSAVGLAIGYNGLDRVLGLGNSGIASAAGNSSGNFLLSSGLRIPPGGGEAGQTGAFRLFGAKNAGQIAWFLIPALCAALALAYFVVIDRRRAAAGRRFAPALYIPSWFYWAACWVPMAVYFSFAAGVTHRYYFATFAPSIAALAGVAVWLLKRCRGRARFIIPGALAVSAAVQIYIQSLYGHRLPAVFLGAIALCALGLAVAVLATILRLRRNIAISAFAVLLVLPGLWSATPALLGDNATQPSAWEPEALSGRRTIINVMPDLTWLVDYLDEHSDGADFLAAVPCATGIGSQLIIESRGAFMALGGYNGEDRILGPDGLAIYVSERRVRYEIVKVEQRPTEDEDSTVSPASSAALAVRITDLDPTLAAWISSHGKIVTEDDMIANLAEYRVYRFW